MKIICVGYSRSGTKSMAKALTELGFVVHDFDNHVNLNLENYIALLKGEEHENLLKEMYENVDAVVAFPAYVVWYKIFKKFPNSKVILTSRESYDAWYKSFEILSKQTFESRLRYHQTKFSKPRTTKFIHSLMSKTWSKIYALEELGFTRLNLEVRTTTHLKESWIDNLKLHEASVKQLVPKDQFLCFKAGEGWERLCQFLNKDPPKTDFPKENVTVGETVPFIENSRRSEIYLRANSELRRSIFYVVLFLCFIVGLISLIMGENYLQKRN